MNRIANKKGLIFFTAALVLTLAFLAVTCVLFVKNTDMTDVDGIHKTLLLRSNVYSKLYSWLTLIALLFLAVPTVLYKKHTVPMHKEVSNTVRLFLRAGAGFCLVFIIAMQFFLSKNGTPYALDAASSGKVQTASLVFALIGSLYFIVPMIVERPPKALIFISGFSVALWGCAQLLVTHFYIYDFLASPSRILTVLGYCTTIFFILSEIRTFSPSRVASGFYVGLGLVAFFAAAGEAGAKLILCITGSAGFEIGLDTFYILERLFIGVYAFVSVYPVLLYGKKKTLVSPTEENALPEEEKALFESSDNTKQSENGSLPVIGEQFDETPVTDPEDHDNDTTEVPDEEDARDLPEETPAKDEETVEDGFMKKYNG